MVFLRFLSGLASARRIGRRIFPLSMGAADLNELAPDRGGPFLKNGRNITPRDPHSSSLQSFLPFRSTQFPTAAQHSYPTEQKRQTTGRQRGIDLRDAGRR
jgi:hypothetical protein